MTHRTEAAMRKFEQGERLVRANHFYLFKNESGETLSMLCHLKERGNVPTLAWIARSRVFHEKNKANAIDCLRILVEDERFGRGTQTEALNALARLGISVPHPIFRISKAPPITEGIRA